MLLLKEKIEIIKKDGKGQNALKGGIFNLYDEKNKELCLLTDTIYF